MTDLPRGRDARLDILLTGSLAPSVVSSCSLVRSDDVVAVVDPGMAERQSDITGPLTVLGLSPHDVTDVILGHHHPDHTLNAGLFPDARVHDHWAIYRGATWTDRDAEGYELTPSIRLIRTPGHTAEDIATVVGTPEGVVVLTHLWLHEGADISGLDEDPAQVAASRERVLALADLVVPGHGPPFRPRRSPGGSPR